MISSSNTAFAHRTVLASGRLGEKTGSADLVRVVERVVEGIETEHLQMIIFRDLRAMRSGTEIGKYIRERKKHDNSCAVSKGNPGPHGDQKRDGRAR